MHNEIQNTQKIYQNQFNKVVTKSKICASVDDLQNYFYLYYLQLPTDHHHHFICTHGIFNVFIIFFLKIAFYILAIINVLNLIKILAAQLINLIAKCYKV